MKKLLLLLAITMLPIGLYAENTRKGFSCGATFMGGLRYDNLRMCVATDAGVKGGPFADIQLSTKYRFNEKHALTFNLPVMRPILFALAFDMLQFEPEITFEFRKEINKNISIITGPGLGASLHYGPDYNAENDNRGDEFFAAGPFICGLFGLAFWGPGKTSSMIGIRAFYIPLFSADRSTGTVLGAGLEYSIYF